MASSKEYLEFILEQLSLANVTYKPMMGEYILYAEGKVIGGIYDDRFLIKPTPSAMRMIPDAPLALPYVGAKEMILMDNLEDKEFLAHLILEVASDLPSSKKRK